MEKCLYKMLGVRYFTMLCNNAEYMRMDLDLNQGQLYDVPGNTKGGSITVPLTSCLSGLESAVRLLTVFVFICKTD